MVDFSNLKKYEQNGVDPRPYKFEMLEGAPTIWSLPATKANPKFMNESLRRSNARAASNRSGKAVTVETVEASMEEDREVFAKTCAVKWDVKDANKQPVEFSEVNCLEFFQALPDWIFEGYQNWVSRPTNFVDSLVGADALGEG